MRGAIAGAARAVSAKVVRADIAVIPAGSAAAGRRSGKTQRTAAGGQLSFFLFFGFVIRFDENFVLSRIAMER